MDKIDDNLVLVLICEKDLFLNSKRNEKNMSNINVTNRANKNEFKIILTNAVARKV